MKGEVVSLWILYADVRKLYCHFFHLIIWLLINNRNEKTQKHKCIHTHKKSNIYIHIIEILQIQFFIWCWSTVYSLGDSKIFVVVHHWHFCSNKCDIAWKQFYMRGRCAIPFENHVKLFRGSWFFTSSQYYVLSTPVWQDTNVKDQWGVASDSFQRNATRQRWEL